MKGPLSEKELRSLPAHQRREIREDGQRKSQALADSAYRLMLEARKDWENAAPADKWKAWKRLTYYLRQVARRGWRVPSE